MSNSRAGKINERLRRFQGRAKNEAKGGEGKALDIIKELIDTSWGGDNEEQAKAVQLLKGLAFSEEELSNNFMKALDEFTSGLKAEDFQ